MEKTIALGDTVTLDFGGSIIKNCIVDARTRSRTKVTYDILVPVINDQESYTKIKVTLFGVPHPKYDQGAYTKIKGVNERFVTTE